MRVQSVFHAEKLKSAQCRVSRAEIFLTAIVRAQTTIDDSMYMYIYDIKQSLIRYVLTKLHNIIIPPHHCTPTNTTNSSRRALHLIHTSHCTDYASHRTHTCTYVLPLRALTRKGLQSWATWTKIHQSLYTLTSDIKITSNVTAFLDKHVQ